MAASGELKARIQLLQAAKARAEATGKSLKPEIQRELDSYAEQGLLGASASGGGGRPATREGEDKANAFLIRALGSNTSYEKQGIGARSLIGNSLAATHPDLLNSLPGWAGNSDRRQVADTNQDEFIAATLRQDSGAAIPPDELERQRRIYFPQPGDSADALEAKKLARQRAIQGLIASAGRAVSPNLTQQYPDYFPDQANAAGETASQAAGAAIGAHIAEGGGPASGAPGGTDGSGPPPADPYTPSRPPRPDDDETDTLVAGDVARDQTVSNPVHLTDAQRQAVVDLATHGGSTDEMVGLLRGFGLNLSNADQRAVIRRRLEAVRADPSKAGELFQVSVDNSVHPIAPAETAGVGEGGASFIGGIASNIPFARELAAVGSTVANGGTYEDNLNRIKGERLWEEQNHPWLYGTGAVVGALPAGGAEIGGARAAASAAGRAALREGLPMVAARAAANRAFASRTAIDAAAQSGLYSLGNADGSFTDRLGQAAVGAGIGAITGSALALGGGRVARAMQARGARLATEAPTEAAQAAQMAARQDITLMPQDVAAGPMIARMTQGSAQQPFGANTIKRAASATYDSFRDRVAALAGGPRLTPADVGAPIKNVTAASAAREGVRAEATSGVVAGELGSAPDMTGAGQMIQRGATRWLRDTQERATQLYDRIAIPPHRAAVLDNTRAALRSVTQGLRSNEALSRLWAENPRLKATLEALTPVDDSPQVGALNWQDLKSFRSIVGRIVGQPGLQTDGDQIAALRTLYAGLSEDMRATAARTGPRQLNQFNRANSYFGARANRVRDTVARVMGNENDTTANEAFSTVERALSDNAGGNVGMARRVLATLPEVDANAVRATMVNRMRGGSAFDARQLAKSWSGISDRGKSVLLPQPGLRSIMDDAAERAAAAAHDPLEGKSPEQAYLALERMADNRGDSARLMQHIASLSPDEAQAFRTLFVNRLGLATEAGQDAEGEVFSVASFLTRWNRMSKEARTILFGNGQMRDDMTEVAHLAERVKATEKLAGHSNTGAINNFNTASGGLATAVVALLFGHPVVAAAAAAPAAVQRVTAEVLTSPRLLRWLARAPKKPNLPAQRAHIAQLSVIARAEPAIANDILGLQQRLMAAFETTPVRAAADERGDHRAGADGNQVQQEGQSGNLQPAHARSIP